jgi:predicted small metal-binding protein
MLYPILLVERLTQPKGVKMKSLACRDLGMDCDYISTGNTVEDVKQKAMAHAQVVHADVLKTMTSPAQMAEMQKLMDKMIKQTA